MPKGKRRLFGTQFKITVSEMYFSGKFRYVIIIKKYSYQIYKVLDN